MSQDTHGLAVAHVELTRLTFKASNVIGWILRYVREVTVQYGDILLCRMFLSGATV